MLAIEFLVCNISHVAESRSSRQLDALLVAGGEVAEKIKAAVERTTLWRYRKGKSTPPADAASELERVTEGLVPANGWEAVEPESSPVANPDKLESA